MPIIAFSVVLQVACIVHIMRTGRDRTWIYIVLFLSMIGVAAYVLVELLPSFISPRAVRGVSAQVSKTIDPGRVVRARRRAIELADTVENRKLLAEALLDAGEFDEAAQLYEASLTGLHQDDPALLYGLARAQASQGRYTESLASLDRIAASQSGPEPIERRLFRAVCLEQAGRLDEARALYAAIAERYPGEEARCRYARLLATAGRGDEAARIYEEVARRVERGNKHYRRAQRVWADRARQELAAIGDQPSGGRR